MRPDPQPRPAFRVERINAYGDKVWMNQGGGWTSDEDAAYSFLDARDAQREVAESTKPCYVVDHTVYV